MKRVLLIGATGTFGSRLAGHLARMPELDLVLASRRVERAQAVADRLAPAAAAVSAVALHIARDLPAVLAELKPWLVIDASGPFQFANYDVPRAALTAGAHYLDLADAQDFLLGFEREVQADAFANNRVALAGCSTTPAITTAVVDVITKHWKRIDTVDATIIPGGSNMVGPALAAAVLSQAGVPVTQYRHGRFMQVLGWRKATRVTVPRLGTFRATPAETVDPLTMPARYGLTSRMQFRAGLISQIEQRGFEALAFLRRSGLFKRIDLVAPLLAAGRKLTRLWSHDRGGMVISMRGLDVQAKPIVATWSLLAKHGDGPHVPILPLVAAVRMLLAGTLAPGARIAAGMIPLDAITAEFARLAISTELSQTESASDPFELALGRAAYDALPTIVRQFHSSARHPVWQGQADVDRGTGLVHRLLARLIGLPPAGRDVPVQVSVEPEEDGSEVWTRRFGDAHMFRSRMIFAGGNLAEAFGPATFRFALKGTDQDTELPVVGGRFFGIPIPKFFLPRSTAREFADSQGRFCFDVRIDLPVFGMLVHYRGWLCPKTEVEHACRDSDVQRDLAAE